MTSKIKVDNISKIADDTNIIKKCGSTTTIGSGAGNTVVVCGATVTIGRCGGTVALASGASQTGFGRTGTVDWQTSSIKTATFTAASGEGYFCNTTAGSFTVNLPAGSAGAIVSVQDYNNTFDDNKLTVQPNGSEKINGGAGGVLLKTEGEGITLVYVDSTVGWRAIQDSVFADVGSNYISATGGTITTSGNCRIHTFTGPGTFTVTTTAVCAADNVVSYLVAAGGGAGANAQSDRYTSGGGGAGGVRETKSPVTPYTASPLDGYSTPGNRITLTATSYPITVGAGGSAPPGAAPATGSSGSNSSFSTITSAGGGKGETGGGAGNNGGSGGGGSGGGAGGSGNTPPVTPSQGSNGGSGCGQWNSGRNAGGGGGGAGGVGGNASSPGQLGGPGGTGVETNIPGSPLKVGGGGQGSTNTAISPTAPYSDYGGGHWPAPNRNGEDNTGGGGSGGTYGGGQDGGAGGSGVVIIRYKFQ